MAANDQEKVNFASDFFQLTPLIVCNVIGLYAILGGTLSLLGYVLDQPEFTDWFGIGISIQPNTAIAAISSGIAILLLSWGFNKISTLFSLFTLLIGSTAIFQISSNLDLGIDTLFMYGRSWGNGSTMSPGRMGIPAASSWMLLGTAMFILGIVRRPRWRVDDSTRLTAVVLSIIALLISSLSLIGYLYGATTLYTISDLTTISVQTASFIWFLSIASIALVPDLGPMRLLNDRSPVGVIARNIGPALILLPILLGLLRLVGARLGYYDLAFGAAMQTIVEIIVLVGFFGWTSAALRRQSQIAAEHQRNFQKMADAMPQVVWIADDDGRFNYFNDRVSNFNRAIYDGAGGFDIYGVIHRNDVAATENAWSENVNKREEFSFEHRVLMSDGTYRWHLSRAIPVIGEDSGKVRWFGTSTDIHDLKGSESALRESDLRFRLAQDAGNVGIWDWSVIDDRTYWSERMWAMYDEDVLTIDPDLNFWSSHLHPDDRELAKDNLKRSLLSDATQHYDIFRIVRPNGTIRWLESLSTIERDDDAKPLRMYGANLDITERKSIEERVRRSEDQLRLITDSVPALISYVDIDSKYRFANRKYHEWFGLDNSEIIGRPINEILGTEAEAEFKRSVSSVSSPGDIFLYETTLTDISGNERYVQISYMPDITVLEELAGFFVLVSDLTDRRQGEIELQNARDQLEARVNERTRELADTNVKLLQQMDERARIEEQRIGLLKRLFTVQEDERARLARDMHDQLGQRLTALRLKIASIKEQFTDDQILRERLIRLHEIAEHLDREVSFMAWEMRPAILDDTDFARAIEQYVKEWSRYSNIFAEFDSTIGQPLNLDHDVEVNLYRIVQEALNNAAKYANAQQVNVLLEKRGTELLLIIEDNGLGFNLAEKDAEMMRGFGLTGMRERATLIGGTIEIESVINEGTTIYVRVPLDNNG